VRIDLIVGVNEGDNHGVNEGANNEAIITTMFEKNWIILKSVVGMILEHEIEQN